MCIATAAVILGVGATAFGKLEGGMFAGQVADNNAKIAGQNAEYSAEAGEEQAAITSRKGAAEAGQLKASQGASGVDVNSGSSVDTQVGERETNLLDTLTVRNNAALATYGYKTQQANFKAQAGQDREAGIIDAASTLLGGASSINWGTGSTSTSTPAIDPSLP